MTSPGYTVRIRGGSTLTSREYYCSDCDERFDELVASPPPPVIACPVCALSADLMISAPAVHVQFVVSATRGANDAKPSALAMDTRPLAEGQPLHEWKAERKKLWENHRRRQVKELVE